MVEFRFSNANDTINAFRAGRQLRNQQQDRDIAEQKRNALIEAGNLAAQGNLQGAQNQAFSNGLLDAAKTFRGFEDANLKRQQNQANLEREKDARDLNLVLQTAQAAQNPEQFEQGKQQLLQQGIDPKVVQLMGDFSNRDFFVNRSLTVKQQLDRQLQQDKLSFEKDKFAQTQASKNQPKQQELTKGQIARDKAFAKTDVKFQTGEKQDIDKNISQLESVVTQLKSGADNLSGPIVGNTPDFIGTIVNPQAVDLRENVEEVVQRNLRLVLGAQFTQKEGERLISRAFNPRLQEGRNAVRVQRLLNQIKGALKARQDASDYFERFGTLKGFRGKTNFTVRDFEQAIDGKSRPKSNNSSNNFQGFSIRRVQ